MERHRLPSNQHWPMRAPNVAAHLRLYLQLLRTPMTGVSAATFAAAALSASSASAAAAARIDEHADFAAMRPSTPVSPRAFVAAYLFVLLTQFSTHALGDAADLRSDRLNRRAGPLTGGSRALLSQPRPPPPRANAAAAAAAAPGGRHGAGGGPPAAPAPAITARQARLVGYALMLCAQAVLHGCVPSPDARMLGMWIAFGAWAYGEVPLRLNARALGEVEAAVVTSILLPLFTQAAVRPPDNAPFSVWHDPSLILLVLPPFLVKIAVFLVLNMADRRPDWAANKITLAVVLGDKHTAQLVAALIAACYASTAFIGLARWTDSPGLCLYIVATAPYAWRRVVRPLFKTDVYVRNEGLAPVLLLSTVIVWIIALYHLIARVLWYGGQLVTIELLFTLWRLSITISNLVKASKASKSATSSNADDESINSPTTLAKEVGRNETRREDQAESSDDIPDSTVTPGVSFRSFDSGQATLRTGSTLAQADMAFVGMRRGEVDSCVTIVGAGISGLAAAASLRRLGRTVVVLERKASPTETDAGADLALWPGAIAILRELGIANEVLARDCYPLDTVLMCSMDFEHVTSTVLKSIDMLKVTEGTGECFVLAPRNRLMAALRSLVPVHLVTYDAKVVRVVENDEDEYATVVYETGPEKRHCRVRSRVVIGADGAHSALRSHVVADCGGDASVQFCGEVCYRGIIPLDDGSEVAAQVKSLLPDDASRHTMRICYGAGLRSSFGYMSADGSLAYWWVKQPASRMPAQRGKMPSCPWPGPLRTLHDATPNHSFYLHPIEDSAVLRKWSTVRVVLVGDSAHTVTPNMGQGACQGVEDAFVLSVQLARFWRESDGQLEAFYQYERARKPYASAVRSEARTQLFLGQLRRPLAVALREALLKAVPSFVLEKKLRGHNCKVDEYIKLFRDCERDCTSSTKYAAR